MIADLISSTGSPRGSTNEKENTLLIVDDAPEIRRSLSRLFICHFDLVLTAGTPDEAGDILKQFSVSQIVADYDLGRNHPPGTELVVEWRRRYPLIRRALLLSGTRLADRGIPPEVDCFLSKGEDPKLILNALKS